MLGPIAVKGLITVYKTSMQQHLLPPLAYFLLLPSILGYFKERQYIAQSNFNFEFVAEVMCESTPQSSGFLLSVTREGSDGSRYNYTIQRNHCVLHFNYCFVTNDSVNETAKVNL